MTSVVSDNVFRFRAIRSLGTPLEDDPEVMVHQQLARLRFFEEKVGSAGKRVLDFGCGSGFNCHEMKDAKEVLGFDLSADAITLAQSSFPSCSFKVADGCDRNLSLGKWERILCCEVLEHVPDMESFLDNLRDHLSPDGMGFISTPNKAVFSLGHEPSPMNLEHMKELTLDEFDAMLKSRFARFEIYGQRFTKPELLEAWKADVRSKIAQLEAGTRWQEKPVSSIKQNRVMQFLYSIGPIRKAWKWLRWGLIEGAAQRRAVASRPYDYRDFEFSKDYSDSIWFCAIVWRV